MLCPALPTLMACDVHFIILEWKNNVKKIESQEAIRSIPAMQRKNIERRENLVFGSLQSLIIAQQETIHRRLLM